MKQSSRGDLPEKKTLPEEGRAVINLRVTRRQVTIIVVAVLITWVAILAAMLPRTSEGIQYVRALYQTKEVQRFKSCNKGPWGDLEYSVVSLEMPGDYVDAFYCKELPEWFFPGFGEKELIQLAQDARLTPSQKAVFLDKSRWTSSGDGVLVKPDKQLVLQLAPDSRAKIYAVLSSSPRNEWQRSPLVHRSEMVKHWLDGDSFSPEVVSLIKSLSYTRGGVLVFSDVELVFSSIDDKEERESFVAHLFSKTALLVRLRLRPETDIHTLGDYWENEANAPYVRSFLRSVATARAEETVDIIHLLPPLPRMLLYTNRAPEYRPALDRRDCFWTSGNFFNSVADDSLSDTPAFVEAINTDYFAVSMAKKLGDMIVFIRADQKPVHACNYIADNIVFTKNGRGAAMPWILADLRDVIALYRSVQNFEVRTFRRIDKASAK